MRSEVVLEVAAIRDRLRDVLVRELGLDAGDAGRTVDHLIRAEQAGRHDHGLIRVPYLVASPKFGPYGGEPVPAPRRIGDGRVQLDGRGHLGYPLVDKLVDAGCAEAERHGMCIATTSSVYPSGALCDWAQLAAAQGVGIVLLASSPPRVASPDGRSPVVGTNPICIGIPAEPIPFVADLATSAINHGELLIARASGQPLPVGAAIGADGAPTRDASQVDPTNGLGALLPFGGSHKAFALAMAIELLVSLGGCSPGREDQNGVFCLFLGSSLMSAQREQASEWLRRLADSGSRIPGWQSQRRSAEQRAQGIVAMPVATYEQLERLLEGD